MKTEFLTNYRLGILGTVSILVTLVLFSLGPSGSAAAQSDGTVNILLIGNSWFQGGDKQLDLLVGGAGDLWANGVYHGGYSLAAHWKDEEQMAKIQAQLERGIYDYVLLMDVAKAVINEAGENTHRNYVLHFKDLFDQYGVQTVLAMPWAYITKPEQQAVITANEYAVGDELGLLVAPVGEAFRRSSELRPDLQLLLGDDNSHPSAAGDYLRNLVVYSTIMDRPPTDLGGIEELSQEDEDFLKSIAWSTIQEKSEPATATPETEPSTKDPTAISATKIPSATATQFPEVSDSTSTALLPVPGSPAATSSTAPAPQAQPSPNLPLEPAADGQNDVKASQLLFPALALLSLLVLAVAAIWLLRSKP